MDRRSFLQTVAGSVAVSTVATGVHASATDGTEGADPISYEVSYRQSPSSVNRVGIQVNFQLPESISAMTWPLPGFSNLIGSEGFDSPSDGSIEWDAESGELNPSFTAIAEYPEQLYPRGSEWTIGSKHVYPPEELKGASWSPESASHSLLSEGRLGDSFAFFGPYQEQQRQTSWGSVSLVGPDDTDLALPETTLLDAYETAGESLTVNGPVDDVTVFTVPEFGLGRAKTSVGDIVAEEDLKLPYDNTWIHEFVHTQQDYNQTPETRWLSEGLAEYYGYSLLHELEDRTYTYEEYRALYEDKLDDAGSVVLTDPDTWEAPQNYYVGSLAVQVIDVSIRIATDLDSTFQDVFRRLNDYDDGSIGLEEEVSHDDFLDIVEDVGGSTPRNIADYYVGTDATPTPVSEPIWNDLYK